MLSHYSNDIEVGCDEAGRGCLAGSVFAAAVILPKDFEFSLVNDSKKLTHKQRLICKEYIENHAIEWSVAQVNAEIIDEINILNASILAMHLALEGIKHNFDLIVVDGNRFKPYKNVQNVCIVKGDSKILSIAAASILAKCHRDDYMLSLHNEFPCYNWRQNKGYPTLKHREAIATFGASRYHRTSFKLLVD